MNSLESFILEQCHSGLENVHTSIRQPDWYYFYCVKFDSIHQ